MPLAPLGFKEASFLLRKLSAMLIPISSPVLIQGASSGRYIRVISSLDDDARMVALRTRRETRDETCLPFRRRILNQKYWSVPIYSRLWCQCLYILTKYRHIASYLNELQILMPAPCCSIVRIRISNNPTQTPFALPFPK